MESALVEGILPIFSFCHSLKSGLHSWWNHYVYLVHTQQDNQRLKEQLARLKQENLRLQETALAQDRLKKLLQLKTELPEPSLAAEVVGSGPAPFLQSFYVNKGKKDGVVRGMPVLIPQGVAGRVERTSGHYALVTLIYDPGFAVDCLIQRSRVRGVLTGIAGENRCKIKYINRADDVRPGDLVLTSGLDGLFPKGMSLGRVVRVDPKVKGTFLHVEVLPEVNLTGVEEVLILKKRPPIPEQEPPFHE